MKLYVVYLFFYNIALHPISALAYGVMSPLLAATVLVQHRLLVITMRLHTLLGMKVGDMAFALYMHYKFGLWHMWLGLRLWESL
jgi:hypothetical protein